MQNNNKCSENKQEDSLIEYRFVMKNEEKKENLNISGKFKEEEWKLINRFVEYADDLTNTKFRRELMQSKLTINYSQDGKMEIKTELPNWDDVIVFLHKYRPIGLNSENTSFNRITNLLKKKITNDYLRKIIDEQKDIFTGVSLQKTFRIQINDILVNSEDVLNKWLNAYEYHRDEEKQQFMESLNQVIPDDALKVIFISLLSYKAVAIYNIAGLIKLLVGKEKEIHIK